MARVQPRTAAGVPAAVPGIHGAGLQHKLGEYGGGQFNITGSQNAGDETIVDSEIARANGQPVQIDWHVIDEGGQNKITDVYVDRVSMKVTQRDEFAKIIENNGGQPSALLAVLRQELRSKQQPTPVR